jgi:hypothetical protein
MSPVSLWVADDFFGTRMYYPPRGLKAAAAGSTTREEAESVVFSRFEDCDNAEHGPIRKAAATH